MIYEIFFPDPQKPHTFYLPPPIMINIELAELYKEQERLRKELSRVSSKIGQMCRFLDDETIEETKSSVTPDPVQFSEWLRKRRQRNLNIATRYQCGKKIIPKGYTGVYALYRENEVIYVGITKNIEERLKGHKDKEYDNYEILQVHSNRFYAMKHEHDLIEKFNPIHNKSRYM